MQKIQFIIAILMVVVLTGCGTSINLTKYSPSTLDKTKYMPSKKQIMSDSLPKVIVMNLDNNDMKTATQANLGGSMATKINSLLTKGKSVRILKRIQKVSYDKMISREIKAAQLSKELGTDVGGADYIITGQIGNSTYDHSFREGYYYYVKTKKGKVKRYASPTMSYTACATGNIKIFTLPTLLEADSFEFDECVKKSTVVRSSRDIVRRNDGLIRRAGDEGADTISYALKNFFSKKAYIYEMKKESSNRIVKVTLGLNHGAKEGEEVNFYKVEDSFNVLTEQSKQEEIIIGTGTISDQITETSSWVIVDELNLGKTIQAGDFIKINYEEGFFSKTGKYFK